MLRLLAAANWGLCLESVVSRQNIIILEVNANCALALRENVVLLAPLIIR